MDEFLKKELEKIEIPQQVYLEARDQAWARLQEKSLPSRAKILWAAAAAAMVLAVLLGLLKHNPPKTEGQVQSPLPTALPGAVDHPLEAKPAEIAQSPRAAVRRRQPPVAAPGRSDQPDRVVMNFVLPDSGVRMIWIMDKNFKIDGGNE